MITLTKIAMRVPTRECIYAPCSVPRQITEAEFMDRYADHPCATPVSFEPDGHSNPQQVTAYADGMDCWYIVQ